MWTLRLLQPSLEHPMGRDERPSREIVRVEPRRRVILAGYETVKNSLYSILQEERVTQRHDMFSMCILCSCCLGPIFVYLNLLNHMSEGGKKENYHILSLIGQGAYGHVYKARRKLTGQFVAIKSIKKKGKEEKDIKVMRDEI